MCKTEIKYMNEHSIEIAIPSKEVNAILLGVIKSYFPAKGIVTIYSEFIVFLDDDGKEIHRHNTYENFSIEEFASQFELGENWILRMHNENFKPYCSYKITDFEARLRSKYENKDISNYCTVRRKWSKDVREKNTYFFRYLNSLKEQTNNQM